MVDVISTLLTFAESVKAAFIVIAGFALTDLRFPGDATVNDGDTYDAIVVGVGSAGSILVNRLTEIEGLKVLGIEAGGNPHFETDLPPAFPFEVGTVYDFNYTTTEGNELAQYHRHHYFNVPAGCVIGGSSVLHHLYCLRGASRDYDDWVTATGNSSWSFANLLDYFKKTENYQGADKNDSAILQYHGTNGTTHITKEDREDIYKYLQAFSEAGHSIVDDVNNGNSMGFAAPMYYISEAGARQSSALYVTEAKDRPNLYIKKNTKVTKILINDSKQATGVQCVDADGNTFNVTAKQIIVTAGTVNTAKLLLLSGIGPQADLEALGIPVVADLPVGQNYSDHMGTILLTKFAASNATVYTDPTKYPVPTFIGFAALNETQEAPDYYTMNLICNNTPAAVNELSSLVFSLNVSICEQMYDACTGYECVFTVLTKSRPVSTGYVRLTSTSPDDAPIINIGMGTNSVDITDHAKYIQNFIKVNESSVFTTAGAEIVRFDMPQCDSYEYGTQSYWECYVGTMSDTIFHGTGTSRMGTVLNADLTVKGIDYLTVADASAMPNLISGNINEGVVAIAERAADILKTKLQ